MGGTYGKVLIKELLDNIQDEDDKGEVHGLVDTPKKVLDNHW